MPARAIADESDPPSRAARLAYAQGSVSFEPAGTDDWITAVLNRPLTTGDKVWSDSDGRVEMQLDGSLLRLSNNTAMSFLNLSDNVTQLQLSAGTVLIHVRRLDRNETYEVDTPNLAFSILQPGLYRLTVDEAGGTTAIRVRAGEGEVTGGGTAYTLHANEYDVFTGTDQLAEVAQQYDTSEDQFDAWSTSRDSRRERSASARYVSPDVVGYEDLDDQGAWRPTPGYGHVWFPRTPRADWAPYHNGHWAYIEPWGYTWVDDQPWGFAPFHYGRWVSVNGAWGWVPSPPRVEGVPYVRPVYAPALVAWVGVGAGVAWFALGPREVYVPSHPVSRNYVNNVNVSNTTVNTTVINNYYNTTIVNKTVNVTNVKYVNQRVPGAVAATTSRAFSSAQPVARNAVRVDQHAIASAPVRAFTPAVIPVKQAVLGTGRVAAMKPPVTVQTRAVVAKVAPPALPPTFEKQQEAIKNNGGKPLSVTQLRQIQPSGQQRTAAIKIAPPAKPAISQTSKNAAADKNSASTNKPPAKPVEPNKAAPVESKKPAAAAATKQPASAAVPPVTASHAVEPPVKSVAPIRPAPPQSHPPERPAGPTTALDKPAATAVHPKEPPPAAKIAPPSPANPQLEQKHQQEQAQLRAKQDQERQKVQAQQALERKQLAQQKLNQAKKQQLEQQQLQEKQLQEKKQEATKAQPKAGKDDHPAKGTPSP